MRVPPQDSRLKNFGNDNEIQGRLSLLIFIMNCAVMAPILEHVGREMDFYKHRVSNKELATQFLFVQIIDLYCFVVFGTRGLYQV